MTAQLAPEQLRRPGVLVGLLRATRPRQWLKNLLVLAAPAAAGVVLTRPALLRSLGAAVSFTAVAAGCYLLNDVLDRVADAAHPRKRHRPVASGAVPVPLALVAAVLLAVGGLVVAETVSGRLVAVVAGYAAVTLAYGFGLKRVPGLELALVASGFLLRAVGGAAAAHVRVSGWFAVVVAAAALHLVASKRASELAAQPAGVPPQRLALRSYTADGLRSLRWVTAAALVFCYAGWAAVGRPSPTRWPPCSACWRCWSCCCAGWCRRTVAGPRLPRTWCCTTPSSASPRWSGASPSPGRCCLASRLSGWGRTAPAWCDVLDLDPDDDAALHEAVTASGGGRGVLGRGAGRSYGDAAQNSGGTVVRLAGRRYGSTRSRPSPTALPVRRWRPCRRPPCRTDLPCRSSRAPGTSPSGALSRPTSTARTT